MKEVVLTSQEKCLTPQFFAAPLTQRRMDRFLKQLVLLPTRILGSRLPFKGWARSGIFLASCLFLHDRLGTDASGQGTIGRRVCW